MILFVSDLHTRYDLLDRQAAAAEDRFGLPCAAVVVLGDLGLFEPFLKRHFRRRGAHGARWPLYFLEGNHEDFEHFDDLVAAYADCLIHLPRGTVREIAGRRFLCLGGAAYMDAHLTPWRSLIGESDLARCLAQAPEGLAGILSHDCPAGIGVPNTPGFEHYGPPGFAGGEALLARFRPPLWVFGHHHKWFERSLGDTRFYGLAQSWRGGGVLLPSGEFRLFENTLPAASSPHDRLRRWLGV
jgi:predicted phosphodiesterase